MKEALAGLIEDLEREVRFLKAVPECAALKHPISDEWKAQWDVRTRLMAAAIELLAHQGEDLQKWAVIA